MSAPSPPSPPPRVAIIGAGLAGLSCAERLRAAGHEVALFDKGRGPGGRMATRRVEVAGRTLRFDHGAQYFTARDPRFAREVERWVEVGVAARWPAAGAEAFVGTPAMNAPVKALAARHEVRFGARVEAVIRTANGWRLEGDEVAAGGFDRLVVAVPAEQAVPLLEPHAPAIAATARATGSAPCWTLMVRFTEPIALDDVLRDRGAIGWAARDSAKPGRGGGECWVVQAGPDWSAAHLEEQAVDIAARLLGLFEEAVPGRLPPADHVAAHRWRYARSGAAGTGPLWDAAQGVGACGDWLRGPRVEDAWLSGLELARCMVDASAGEG